MLGKGHLKVVQSGKTVEVWQYEKEHIAPRRQHVRKKKNRYRKRFRSAYAAEQKKKTFERLVRTNLDFFGAPVLMTLTYKANMGDLKRGWQDYSHFMKRLRRALSKNVLRYIAVPEFQKRGAVHFHVLVWGVPLDYVKSERNTRLFADIWGHGFLDLHEADDRPQLAGYLAKYLSKTYLDDRLREQRCYGTSRNIERPATLKSRSFDFKEPTAAGNRAFVPFFEEAVGFALDQDDSLEFQKRYDTKWLGTCEYRRYRIK